MQPRLLRMAQSSVPCLLALTLICLPLSLQAVTPPARLNSTFLQLSRQHQNWTDTQWADLFNYFRKLQLSEVFVQWTAYDDLRFYGTNSTLDKVLVAASHAGLKVWVGLYSDSGYWNRVGNGQDTRAFLNDLRSRSLAIARDLAPFLKQQSSFAGWYLPEEVEDVNWQTLEARRELLLHLGLASRSLHELTPRAPVAISAFSDARISPAEFRDFWLEVFDATSVDTVLLQDGIGVHKLELDEFPLYAGALAKAAHSKGRDFRIVVELFQQTGGVPLDSGPFRASSAHWERVRAQMESANQFTTSIVGFSIPEYMTPLGIAGAEKLYADYLKGAVTGVSTTVDRERSNNLK